MPLRIESKTANDVTILILHGSIDEHSELALPKSLGPKVVIDMADVDRINSVGINRWLPVIRELSSTRSVRAVRLSYAASIQAANIIGLFGSAVIDSCLAPYYCAACGATPTVEVTRQEYAATRQPPKRTCPTCSKDLEFDELEEYLAFLERRA